MFSLKSCYLLFRSIPKKYKSCRKLFYRVTTQDCTLNNDKYSNKCDFSAKIVFLNNSCTFFKITLSSISINECYFNGLTLKNCSATLHLIVIYTAQCKNIT